MDIIYKTFCMMGVSGSGKTEFAKSFNKSSDLVYSRKIKKFIPLYTNLKNENIRICILDDKRLFVTGIDGYIFIFNIYDRCGFNKLNDFFELYKKSPIIIIGNDINFPFTNKNNRVDYDEILKFSEFCNCKYIELSATNKKNVVDSIGIFYEFAITKHSCSLCILCCRNIKERKNKEFADLSKIPLQVRQLIEYKPIQNNLCFII